MGGARGASGCCGPVRSVSSTSLILNLWIFWPIWKILFFRGEIPFWKFEILDFDSFSLPVYKKYPPLKVRKIPRFWESVGGFYFLQFSISEKVMGGFYFLQKFSENGRGGFIFFQIQTPKKVGFWAFPPWYTPKNFPARVRRAFLFNSALV